MRNGQMVNALVCYCCGSQTIAVGINYLKRRSSSGKVNESDEDWWYYLFTHMKFILCNFGLSSEGPQDGLYSAIYKHLSDVSSSSVIFSGFGASCLCVLTC